MPQAPRRILVFGATGMLGHVVFRVFAGDSEFDVTGTVRSTNAASLLPSEIRDRTLAGVDVENPDSVAATIERVRPDVVINCVGLVKQMSSAEDPLVALPINAMFPHRLAHLCSLIDARLIHISTDCVFSGSKGMYTESDPSDAKDLYGRSKFLGEVDAPHAITLRTSMIGHELAGSHGLLEWFLKQTGTVKGYRKAIFSGLPTVELARVMREHVLPRPELRGVYHVTAAPIAKYDLLVLLGREYGQSVAVTPDDQFVIDRSLDGRRFRDATGYVAPSWTDLVREMHEFHLRIGG